MGGSELILSSLPWLSAAPWDIQFSGKGLQRPGSSTAQSKSVHLKNWPGDQSVSLLKSFLCAQLLSKLQNDLCNQGLCLRLTEGQGSFYPQNLPLLAQAYTTFMASGRK